MGAWRERAVALVVTAMVAGTLAAVGIGGGVASAASSPVGIGTKAALGGPHCDAETGRVEMVYVFAPPCVKPFSEGASNGGATAQGVTADTVEVVVYTGIPADQAPEDTADRSKGQLATNFALGGPGTIEDAIHDTTAAVGHVLETYGRTIEFSYLTRTGTDEAAQRADAVTAAERKPFAVLDLASAELFCTEVASRKIIVICTTGTNESMDAQKPYRYSTFIDFWANVISTAELVGRNLKGKPAKWAGDAATQQKTRTFGVVYTDGQTGIDVDLWKQSLAKYGAPKMAAELPYDPGVTEVTGNGEVAQREAPVMISKLKDAGVTTVVLFTDVSMNIALMTQANSQDYHPEWIQTGFLFQDIPQIARLVNQEQWAHAFGVGTLNIPIRGRPAGDVVLAWYWGDENFSYNAGVLGEIVVLTFGLHLAGPKLNADTFRNGVFSVGALGGAITDDPGNIMLARGKAPGVPYTEYLFGGDHTLLWWDPEAVLTPASSSAAPQKGAPRYLEDGTRYLQGKMPKGELPFFDAAVSPIELDGEPKPLPDYPCDDCPSSGNGQQPGAP